MNKSRRMRLSAHVQYMGGDTGKNTEFLSNYLKESNHLGDLGVDGRIIIKWY
jgi:hypothetical protein